jgi:hypothetical protein
MFPLLESKCDESYRLYLRFAICEKLPALFPLARRSSCRGDRGDNTRVIEELLSRCFNGVLKFSPLTCVRGYYDCLAMTLLNDSIDSTTEA